jgi:histidinol-phosphate aminotransferase
VSDDRRVPVRPDLALGEGYHSPQVEVAVRLNTNEAPEPPPAELSARIAEAVRELPLHRYPDRRATALRQALADHHGVGADQVLVGNGSNEVIQAVCLAFGGPGRVAAVFEPTYALHSHIARITGTEVAVGERARDFTLDIDEVRKVWAATGAQITFLCSPNNPTGTVEDAATIAAVVDEAPGLVLVDEAYGQFAPHSALDLFDGEQPLVVTRTYSKTWAMAALRLGYLIGPAWLVAAAEEVVLPYHVDALKQEAGRLALDFLDEMHVRVAAIQEERGRLVVALGELDVDVFPSGANFVLFRPRSRAGHEVWERLLDHSVLVRDFSSSPRLEGCLRVTVGTRRDDDAFLAALQAVLA